MRWFLLLVCLLVPLVSAEDCGLVVSPESFMVQSGRSDFLTVANLNTFDVEPEIVFFNESFGGFVGVSVPLVPVRSGGAYDFYFSVSGGVYDSRSTDVIVRTREGCVVDKVVPFTVYNSVQNVVGQKVNGSVSLAFGVVGDFVGEVDFGRSVLFLPFWFICAGIFVVLAVVIFWFGDLGWLWKLLLWLFSSVVLCVMVYLLV